MDQRRRQMSEKAKQAEETKQFWKRDRENRRKEAAALAETAQEKSSEPQGDLPPPSPPHSHSPLPLDSSTPAPTEPPPQIEPIDLSIPETNVEEQ